MFNEVLHRAMINTEGCFTVLIMGTDGIAVEKVWQGAESEQANFEITVAEYTSLLKNTNRINGDLKIGHLREMTISTQHAVFILRFVGEDYFLVMAMSSEGNFGRGRYELLRAGLLLEKELII
jgi:predicted regulator of Ras-like GTPase activity (Roadblock/LC7/MglB family)